jgi:hypothetical protein
VTCSIVSYRRRPRRVAVVFVKTLWLINKSAVKPPTFRSPMFTLYFGVRSACSYHHIIVVTVKNTSVQGSGFILGSNSGKALVWGTTRRTAAKTQHRRRSRHCSGGMMGQAHVILRMLVEEVGAQPWRHPLDQRRLLRGPSDRQQARSWPRSSPVEACSTRRQAQCTPQRSSLQG